MVENKAGQDAGNGKLKGAVILGVFAVYMLCLLLITVIRPGRVLDERQLNLTPFADLINVFQYAELATFVWLFFGNIVWFIPFGFLFPVVIKRHSFWIALASGFLLSLSIETTQYVFRKWVAETDDVILNTLGAAIGYGLLRLFHLIYRKTRVVKDPDVMIETLDIVEPPTQALGE